ncbi:MAG: hypothetical protein U0903_10770 [Planctomycetales bacterium]
MNALLERFSLPLLSRDFRAQAEKRRTYWVRALSAIGIYFYALMFGLYENQYANASFFWYLGRGKNVLDAMIGIEVFGVYLLIPAWLSGAIAGEKERQTLTLLLGTRLGAWRILMEKYLAAMLRVGLYLVLSLPILAVAYPLGGFSHLELMAGIWTIYLSALYVGGLTLFCSCLCATMPGAYLMTYALLFVLMFTPLVLQHFLGQTFVDELVDLIFPGLRVSHLYPFMAGQGNWNVTVAHPVSAALQHMLYQSLPALIQTCAFLLLARWVFVARALNPTQSAIKRIRQFLASGPTLGRRSGQTRNRSNTPRHDLPERDPIAWRENRRTMFGVILGIALTVLGLILKGIYFAQDTNDAESEFIIWTLIELAAGIFWIVAQGTGIFQREQARQTLDVLVATPILTEDLLQQKLRRTWRIGAWYFSYFALSTLLNVLAWYGFHFSPPPAWAPWPGYLPALRLAYSLNFITYAVVYIPLLFWLAFGISLRTKSQGKAMIAVILTVVAWTIGPFMLLIAFLTAIGLNSPVTSDFGLMELCVTLLSFVSPVGLMLASAELMTHHPVFVFSAIIPGVFVFHFFLLVVLRWICLQAAVLKLGRLDRPQRYQFLTHETESKFESALVESSP